MKKEDLIVVLEHNWGRLEVSIEEWIQNGPGNRVELRPIEIKDVNENKPFSLNELPLKYRNNKLSRFLIRLGIIANPWKNKKSQ